MITIPDPVFMLILFFGSVSLRLNYPGNSIFSLLIKSESILISDFFRLSWDELLCEFLRLNELGLDFDFY